MTITVFVGLFSLPPLIFGWYLLACWVRIQSGNLFYVEFSYLATSLVLIGLGVLSFFSTLYGAWRRSFFGLLFGLPLMAGLVSMIAIPDAFPHMHSRTEDTNYLLRAHSFLSVWYDLNHRFPANQAEFMEAMTRGPAAWGDRVQAPPSDSSYKWEGKRLPYEVVVVTNAIGPRVSDVSKRPGVIYYCVSTGQQKFWMTMTTLDSETAAVATLRTVGDSPNTVWVVEDDGRDYPGRIH